MNKNPLQTKEGQQIVQRKAKQNQINRKKSFHTPCALCTLVGDHICGGSRERDCDSNACEAGAGTAAGHGAFALALAGDGALAVAALGERVRRVGQLPQHKLLDLVAAVVGLQAAALFGREEGAEVCRRVRRVAGGPQLLLVKLAGVCGREADVRAANLLLQLTKGMETAGGVSAHVVVARLLVGLDDLANVLVAGARAQKVLAEGAADEVRLVAKAVLLLCGNLLHARAQLARVAAKELKEVALKVGRNVNVHGRRARLLDKALRLVLEAGEEAVQNVVLVGGHDKLVSGQAHALCVVARKDVAKVAGGHNKVDLVANLVLGHLHPAEVAEPVVDDLSEDARPVDAVDGAEADAGVELLVAKELLHNRLAVIKGAADRHVVHVLVHHAGHLSFLDRRDLASRKEHKDFHAELAAQTGNGRTASVAAGGSQNRLLSAVAEQEELKKVAHKLQSHVLERGGRAVELLQQIEAAVVGEADQRGDVLVAEGAVGCPHHGLERRAGNVLRADVALHHLDGEIGVGELAPLLDLLGRDLRQLGRDVQAAVRREAVHEGGFEGDGLCRFIARADVGRGCCGALRDKG
eukprot:m.210287 g.210287  ORF g.210287 m.210287 type:complete len:581 (-) comp17817_c0_seq5:5838-7580(-)